MTTIRHGGPPGLQTRMRSAESNENRGFFLEHCPIQPGTGLEGGVFQDFSLRSTTASFVYITHSAVVITCESARPLRTRKKGGDESDPPQKRGGMRTRIAARCSTPLSGPMGSLSSSFIPAGRLRNPPSPSRFIVSDRSSPSRVRFAASRPGRLRADPKDALLTRGKGGCRSASDFVSHLIALYIFWPWGREGGLPSA